MGKIKKLIRVTFVTLIALFSMHLNSNAQAKTDKEYALFANQFFTDLQNKKFEKLYTYFSDSLKNNLSLEEFKSSSEAFFKRNGKIVKEHTVIIKKMPPFMVTIKPLEFQKSNLEMRLAFNANQQISGLFFTQFDPKKLPKGQ